MTEGAVPRLFLPINTKLNFDAVVVFCKPGFRELQFQFCEYVDCGQYGVGIFADALRHLQQDAMNLLEFLFEQANQFVVLFDGFERFDEDGLSAGTRAMDYALYAAFLLDLNGDHETFAADGNELVSHRTAFRQATQVTTQRFLDGAALLFDLAADVREFVGRFVFQGAVRLNLIAEEPEEVGEIEDPFREFAHAPPFGVHGSRRVLCDFAPLSGAIHCGHYVENISRFEHGARDTRFFHKSLDLHETGKVEASADTTEFADFRRKLLLCFDRGAIGRGDKSGDTPMPQRRRGMSVQQVAQRLSFQHAG